MTSPWRLSARWCGPTSAFRFGVAGLCIALASPALGAADDSPLKPGELSASGLNTECTSPATGPSAPYTGACLGYIRGVYELWGNLSGTPEAKTLPSLCLPDGVTDGEMQERFVNFYSVHPEMKGTRASVAVVAMLMQAYPCR